MVYLTYNDPPSGIYSSQVIDVCNFLNKNLNAKIRLVSIISLRGFWRNKGKIKTECPAAIVLPMFPGIGNWKLNIYLLDLVFIFWGKQSVIARGPFATSLALSLKRMNLVTGICFDARGAYNAEFNEYKVAGDSSINEKIALIEKNALLNSDFRIAVSDKLVGYWAEKYEYKASDHVVIPCTINSDILNTNLEDKAVQLQRGLLGFSTNDIIFVYSGSSSGWQSLKLVDDFLAAQMKANPNAKALFLIEKLPENINVVKEFPGRVVVKWLTKDKIVDALKCCDYGLVIRKNSITNRVSSPVKFAEYLAAGLQVIISESIGDYSEFVKQYECGYVLDSRVVPVFQNVSSDCKMKNMEIASKYFSKHSYLNEYSRLLKHLS